MSCGWSTARRTTSRSPTVVQVDPREEGQIALFHIGHDEGVGFEFLDGGDLLFFGDRDAVCARQWDQLTVSPSSC